MSYDFLKDSDLDYASGYEDGKEFMKERAIEACKLNCSLYSLGKDCASKKDGECTCHPIKDFIKALDDEQNHY